MYASGQDNIQTITDKSTKETDKLAEVLFFTLVTDAREGPCASRRVIHECMSLKYELRSLARNPQHSSSPSPASCPHGYQRPGFLDIKVEPLSSKATSDTDTPRVPRIPFGYRGTSLVRNCTPLGPYSRHMPRALWWS